MRTSKFFKAPSKIGDKINRAASGLTAAAGVAMAYVMCGMNVFATDINSNYQISGDFDNLNIEGMILGLAFWIARLVGIGMLVWGIYGYVTARKDGEAESMNGALGKLISGVVLMAMPSVMKGLGIIG